MIARALSRVGLANDDGIVDDGELELQMLGRHDFDGQRRLFDNRLQ